MRVAGASPGPAFVKRSLRSRLRLAGCSLATACPPWREARRWAGRPAKPPSGGALRTGGEQGLGTGRYSSFAERSLREQLRRTTFARRSLTLAGPANRSQRAKRAVWRRLAEGVTSAPAQKQAHERQSRTAGSHACSHQANGDDQARVEPRPAPGQDAAEPWAFMWFQLEGRFIPLIDEGGPLPDAPFCAEATRLTDVLRRCRAAREIPPPEVLRWMDDDDLASVGRRQRTPTTDRAVQS